LLSGPSDRAPAPSKFLPSQGEGWSHNPLDFGAWLRFDIATVTKIKISPGNTIFKNKNSAPDT
jgi:hypothetical protein